MKIKFIRPSFKYADWMLNKIFEVIDESNDKYWVINKNGGSHWFYKNEVDIVKSKEQ